MAPARKLIYLLFMSLYLLFVGCTSTQVPTGDRLVSVSWVNQTPRTLQFIQTEICGDPAAVVLEALPGYSEQMQELNRPLFENCKVQIKTAAGSDTVSLGIIWLDPPLRKSPTREYNLRIQLLPGLSAQASLEPVHLTRERLK